MSNITSNTSVPPPAMPEQRPPVRPTGGKQPVAPPVVANRPLKNIQVAEAAPSAKSEPSAAELKRITEELQRRVNVVAPELEFSVDRSSGRSIIKITDPSTKEVIRQIPSEEALRIGKAMEQFQQGLLLNRKA